MIDPNKRELIAIQVIQVLAKRVGNFPVIDEPLQQSQKNAPFQEAFLQAVETKLPPKVSVKYAIDLASWIHGLSTTTGQSFFEEVAHILSSGRKQAFTSNKNTSLQITRRQKEAINQIISNLKNGALTPDPEEEEKLLRESASDGSGLVKALDFTADNFIEHDAYIEAIEIKSPRPNSKETRGEKQKLLEAKAGLIRQFPNKKVHVYFGFPFDPTSQSPVGYDKKRFLKNLVEGQKLLYPGEVLVAGEFWDHLSGEKNTMREILSIINSIATPDFEDNYQFLKDGKNAGSCPKRYVSLLDSWKLVSEKHIVENRSKLLAAGLSKKLYGEVFAASDKYNHNRAKKLLEALR
jgi:hypothetical protein